MVFDILSKTNPDVYQAINFDACVLYEHDAGDIDDGSYGLFSERNNNNQMNEKMKYV